MSQVIGALVAGSAAAVILALWAAWPDLIRAAERAWMRGALPAPARPAYPEPFPGLAEPAAVPCFPRMRSDSLADLADLFGADGWPVTR